MYVITDSDELDWSTDTDDNDKKPAKLENVLVATCSDDGSARLWYPLQVCLNSTVKFLY